MRVLGGLLLAGVLEIAVLILVGRTIGLLPTLLLLIAGIFAGSWLLRMQGRRALREFSDAAFARRPPSNELAGGVLAAAGAILLMVPGFLSDLAAVAFLLPPTRALMARRLRRAAENRAQAMNERINGYWRRRGGDFIDGEVVSVSEDDDEPSPEHPRLDHSAQAPRPRHRGQSVEPGE